MNGEHELMTHYPWVGASALYATQKHVLERKFLAPVSQSFQK